MIDRSTNESLSADLVVATTDQVGHPDAFESIVVPLHSEEATVSRRKVAKAIIQVATVTHTREERVNEPLTHERIEIERVAIGQIIETAPPIREEGDVTIIPVIEEIVVVEKRLVLKEEVRLRRVRVTEQYQEMVVLREQEAVVTRTPLASAPVPDKHIGQDA